MILDDHFQEKTGHDCSDSRQLFCPLCAQQFGYSFGLECHLLSVHRDDLSQLAIHQHLAIEKCPKCYAWVTWNTLFHLQLKMPFWAFIKLSVCQWWCLGQAPYFHTHWFHSEGSEISLIILTKLLILKDISLLKNYFYYSRASFMIRVFCLQKSTSNAGKYLTQICSCEEENFWCGVFQILWSAFYATSLETFHNTCWKKTRDGVEKFRMQGLNKDFINGLIRKPEWKLVNRVNPYYFSSEDSDISTRESPSSLFKQSRPGL